MRLLETFENAQWREVKQMCPMRHCRPFENLFENTQWKKKQTNANSVILYLIRQEIWGDIWKHTVEKSQTNVTSVITHLHPLVHIIWGLIWEHRMEKLNRALCELGYSFSTVIVIVVEMFVILVKMSNNWKREAPPNLVLLFHQLKRISSQVSLGCFWNWQLMMMIS